MNISIFQGACLRRCSEFGQQSGNKIFSADQKEPLLLCNPSPTFYPAYYQGELLSLVSQTWGPGPPLPEDLGDLPLFSSHLTGRPEEKAISLETLFWW